ncbi:hypothetical protein [Ketogulonicigenium vulgare]|uniref:Uncharacterized protein n=1 Tax=Ketogulonicigenium vulgare (strain WSH-001) TaxID=759362 RepID=F9Y7Q6_KETVW|nr:hypothetical protein [Ketogulonicigenium vulgare]ADO41635.1 hypothetical protein EIO_0472 [Ketogulonicigenium vulgare Y25]AEM39872.1 hypothetical protein KVU_0033 [Ketogulonicigenium vulgare WSH-001]ALJ80090.1 hypothetical protein KVH_02200 [Ketogulonicigenium vulgare]ANW32962.1 hypothetical protein KvSKV_02200 [Ketogulonicigenium vulgare]AOZ53566.1 hypothetical protein KVC_0541 [Ketogulonicigenium vulgare]
MAQSAEIDPPIALRLREGLAPNRARMLQLVAGMGPDAFQMTLREEAAQLEQRLLRLNDVQTYYDIATFVRHVGVIAEIAERFGFAALERVAGNVLDCHVAQDDVAFAATLARLERLGHAALFMLACQLAD